MIKVFIENLPGSKKKREFDSKSECWRRPRTLQEPFPYIYGFIPNTVAPDNDELDIFLITEKVYKRGDLMNAEPIGAVQFLDCGEVDDKIICRDVHSKLRLSKAIKEKLRFFLNNTYKNDKKKNVKVGNFLSKAKAQQMIKQTLLKK